MKFLLLLLALCATQLQAQETIPEYLAIVAQGKPRVQVSTFTHVAMAQLLRQFPHDQDLSQGYRDLMNHIVTHQGPWKDASPWHITCLYIGNDTSKLSTPYYTEFVPNKKINIYSSVFVFVPNRLAIGPVKIDRTQILIENEFPHVTLFRNQWPAVMSNDVLATLFAEGRPLHDLYPNKIFDLTTEQSAKFENVVIGDEEVTVYVSSVPENYISLNGLTTVMLD